MQGLVTSLANNVGGLALARPSTTALSIGRFPQSVPGMSTYPNQGKNVAIDF